MSMLRSQNRLTVAIIRRRFLIEADVEISSVLLQVLELGRPRAISGGDILLRRVIPTRERITLIWLQSISAPVARKLTTGHVFGMMSRNFRCQIIDLQPSQFCHIPFFVD